MAKTGLNGRMDCKLPMLLNLKAAVANKKIGKTIVKKVGKVMTTAIIGSGRKVKTKAAAKQTRSTVCALNAWTTWTPPFGPRW